MPVQHRQGAHRAMDQGPDTRAGNRESEDVVSLGTMRRQNSVIGHPSGYHWTFAKELDTSIRTFNGQRDRLVQRHGASLRS